MIGFAFLSQTNDNYLIFISKTAYNIPNIAFHHLILAFHHLLLSNLTTAHASEALEYNNVIELGSKSNPGLSNQNSTRQPKINHSLDNSIFKPWVVIAVLLFNFMADSRSSDVIQAYIAILTFRHEIWKILLI